LFWLSPPKPHMQSPHPHACYLSCPSHPWLHHSNYIGSGKEIWWFLN
jgi:hypothetical protein